MGRAPCCDKERVRKGTWSAEEDAMLKAYVDGHGPVTNWIALPNKIGINRCGKSCRLRWLNYLRPNIKHGGFSQEEDKIISHLYFTIGSRWSVIAEKLEGRTDNDIKNYWNTKLKRKLLGKQNKSGSRRRSSYGGLSETLDQHYFNPNPTTFTITNSHLMSTSNWTTTTTTTCSWPPPNQASMISFAYSQQQQQHGSSSSMHAQQDNNVSSKSFDTILREMEAALLSSDSPPQETHAPDLLPDDDNNTSTAAAAGSDGESVESWDSLISLLTDELDYSYFDREGFSSLCHES